MNLEHQIITHIQQAFATLFDHRLAEEDISLQPTRKDFAGSYTFVTFPYARISRKSPEATAQAIGKYLQREAEEVEDFNVVKGFLNLVLNDATWLTVFRQIMEHDTATLPYGFAPLNGQKVMIEFSSPNTNKPLHLGHLRNNFLGHAMAQLLSANGYEVRKVSIINDRGVHICKSMLAYRKFGHGETPISSGTKGDHLVGDYYVKFDQAYKAQTKELWEKKVNESDILALEQPFEKALATLKEKKNKSLNEEEEQSLTVLNQLKEEAEKEAPLMQEVQAMLQRWEQGDPDTVALWQKMNAWVYEGFAQTYQKIGITFDQDYYESNTYLLGKDIVEEGLQQGVFFTKDDGSVWIDLSGEGLDEKLVLRADGTSVYITQDLGTVALRYQDYPFNRMIYVVGNEQDYHFKVLFLILKKLGRSYADGLHHLSYGMVDLPTGRMKSREGTVVDADDLIAEVVKAAQQQTEELGKIEDFTEAQAEALYQQLGLGALKYFLLKVDPKKRMLFNPEESVQLQGNTAPFIQYTHARIAAILRTAQTMNLGDTDLSTLDTLEDAEREVIVLLNDFPQKVKAAGEEYAPSIIAQYAYDLAKEYNRFYTEISIFGEQDTAKKAFRVALSAEVAQIIRRSMALLGIQVPERM